MTDGSGLASVLQASFSVQGPQEAVPQGAEVAQARFQAAMDQARETTAQPLATNDPNAVAPAVKGVLDRLAAVDGRAQRLAEDAKAAELSGSEFTPGEMVMLSVRAHEFMFHAQLTSNMANRTSDGLQQLFRQQS